MLWTPTAGSQCSPDSGVVGPFVVVCDGLCVASGEGFFAVVERGDFFVVGCDGWCVVGCVGCRVVGCVPPQ